MSAHPIIHPIVESEDLELDASEWEYLAEGNNHIILQYKGRLGNSKSGKVLRLSKAKAAPNPTTQHFYLTHAVLPVMSDRYLECPVFVRYGTAFLNEISQKIEPFRPIARRVKQLVPSEGIAQLESNLCFVPPPLRTVTVMDQLDSIPTACVEIKVKCGLCSVSPWSSDYDSIRRRQHRFSLLQLYKRAQSRVGIRTAWGGDVLTASEYNPADLCSGDTLSVRRACTALLKSPQNNFIVSLSGQRIFGLQQVDVDPLKKACRELFGVEDVDCLLDVISEILSEEDVLQRLQVLQAADLVDVEGATLALARLASLAGGMDAAVEAVNDWKNSEELALSNLARIAEARLTVGKERKETLLREWGSGGSESVGPERRIAVMRLTTELLDLTEAAPRDCKTTVTEWINSLCAADCVCLLRLWLVALGAGDASVIISFRELRNIAREAAIAALSSPRAGLTPDGDRKAAVLQKQTRENTGIVEYSAVEGAPNGLFAYRIAAIDLGPKPAGKLLSKSAEENAICETAMSEELSFRQSPDI
jgi:hypothetical protein